MSNKEPNVHVEINSKKTPNFILKVNTEKTNQPNSKTVGGLATPQKINRSDEK